MICQNCKDPESEATCCASCYGEQYQAGKAYAYADVDPIIDAAWELRQLQYDLSTVNDGHEMAIIMGKLAVARDKLGAALEASPHAMERKLKG